MFWIFSWVWVINLVPNECLNELDGVRQFERAFQDRYADLNRWPTWFRGSLETAINQAVSSSSVTVFKYVWILYSVVHLPFFLIMINLFIQQHFLVKFFVHHLFYICFKLINVFFGHGMLLIPWINNSKSLEIDIFTL